MTSGRLDAAASKAEVLADLCDRLNFDPDAASALHRQLYRQKLDSLLEKQHLTGPALCCLSLSDPAKSPPGEEHMGICREVFSDVL